MKKLYEHFVSSLNPIYKKMINEFIEDCNQSKSLSSFENIINKYGLKGESLLSEHSAVFQLENGFFQISTNHRNTASIEISNTHEFDKNNNFEIKIHHSLINDSYEFVILVKDKKAIENTFKDQFYSIYIQKEGYPVKNLLSENTLDSDVEIGDISKKSIIRNSDVMTLIIEHFDQPKIYKESLFLIHDIKIEDNIILNHLYKSSLTLKNNTLRIRNERTIR